MRNNVLDIVIDLETAGTRADAVILGIGAVGVIGTKILAEDYVPGDITRSGTILGAFHETMHRDTTLNASRSISSDTLAFWDQQDPALWELYFSSDNNPLVALRQFTDWVVRMAEVHKCDTICPWGNGSVFDVTILDDMYRSAPLLDIPWEFRDVRDLRTVLSESGYPKNHLEFQGVKHFALDDAYHEARLLTDCRKAFRMEVDHGE